MIQALIVDDENKSRQVLKKLLARHQEEIIVTGEAGNVEQAYKMIREKKPQLVFLDVQMPVENGFELLMRFDPVPFDVIFITSYDEYAINAIRFSALDYLLKPVDTLELSQAIEKAKKVILSKQSRQVHIINLLHAIDPDSGIKRVGLHVGDSVRFLSAHDISYIEGEGPYSVVYTNGDEKFITPKTLKEFESFFSDCFIRISKSWLVNIDAITGYSKGYEFIILLKNGRELEVSRRRKKEILEKLKKQ
jgi:two-component system, LytTR family, response regulator